MSKRLRILALLAAAACGVVGCVRHVDLAPVDASIDGPAFLGPDASIDAGLDAPGPDAAFVSPDASIDASIDAF